MKTYDNAELWNVNRFYITSRTDASGNTLWYAVTYVQRKPKYDGGDFLAGGALNMSAFFQDTRERVKTLFFGNGEAGKQFATLFTQKVGEAFNVSVTENQELGVKLRTISKKEGGPDALEQLLVEVSVPVEPYYIVDANSACGYRSNDNKIPQTYTTVSALFAAQQTNSGEYIIVEGNGDGEEQLKQRFTREVSRGNYVLISSLQTPNKPSSTLPKVEDIDL